MKYIIHILIVVSCLSCADESRIDSLHDRTITLQFYTSAGTATRTEGEEELNENKVSKIDMFFYDPQGQTCIFSPLQKDIFIHDTKINVSIPDDNEELIGRPLTLYVLANCNLTSEELSGKTLEELQNLVMENTNTFNDMPFTAQENFLMDGIIENVTIPSEGLPDFPTLTLRRAAAKVVIKITNAKIDGYTALNATVRFSNYLDKTTLGDKAPFYEAQKEDYKNSPFRPLSLPGEPVEVNDPFYSYANEWEFQPALESYITIAVEWRENSSGTEKEYYYRIPFNYIPDDPGDERKFLLRRNYIYTFDIDISELGGFGPDEPLELTPHFTLKDWTTHDIIIDLNPYDYLMVDEHYVEMHDITYKEISYTTSKPIKIIMDSVFYRQYASNGDINRIDIQSGSSFYPSITPDKTTNKIHIDCAVPINYVPTYMYFTVKAQGGLYQKVTAILYPRIYITSSFSEDENYTGAWNSDGKASWGSNNPKGHTQSGQTNFNFYTITVSSLSPDDPFTLGDPSQIINHDIYDWIRVTNEDPISNEIISPQFIFASQRGITTPIHYLDARYRCAHYQESPYEKGTWRIPTLAELYLVAYLQRDPNSAIKDLFTGLESIGGQQNYWWTARVDEQGGVSWPHSVKVSVPDGTTEPFPPSWEDLVLKESHYNYPLPAKIPLHAVRCVHDLWRDYSQ